jgi:VWFA-related protein
MVRASGVTIYAIGFKGDNQTGGLVHPMAGDSVLNHLAASSGGAAYFPGSYRDLPKIYDRILEDLGSQYVLGFSSTRPSDGRFHRLRVTLKRPGLKVQHREGYQSPRAPQAAAK